MKYPLALILLALCTAFPVSAELAAWEVLNRTLALQDAVQDYTAQCSMVVNIPGIDLPERHFKVYYKRPDKVKIDSDQAVFLPLEAITLGNLRRHLKQDTEVSLAGVGSFGEEKLYCIKLKPKTGDNAGRVLVWIRSGNWTPTRTEIWKGQTRLLRIDWRFELVREHYWMPTSIVAHIPSGIINDQGPGEVRLTWKSYTINIGLSDDLFRP
jgi:outer membrane lipoprotein-sorting protein